MQNLHKTLHVKGDRARLVLVSCIHVGHTCHARKHFLRWVEEEIMQPDTWCVMLGDTIDNGTKQSPGASIWEQTKNPKDQTLEAWGLLRPLVDAGKVLWWHESNHSFRTFREAGFFTAEEWLVHDFKITWGGWQALTTLDVTRGNGKKNGKKK